MAENDIKSPRKNTPCIGCNGSGQTASFGGESRFMFTWEDCPDCCGTGVQLDNADIESPPEDTDPTAL